MKIYTGIFFILVALLMLPNMVSAHTGLKSSTPANGDTVTKALTEIDLTFATTIEPLSVLKVTGEDGKEIAVTSINGDNDIKGAFKAPLTNGKYKVAWRIIGEDGHNISGEYSFTVAVPPNQAQPSTGNDTAAPTPAPDQPVNDQQGSTASSANDGAANANANVVADAGAAEGAIDAADTADADSRGTADTTNAADAATNSQGIATAADPAAAAYPAVSTAKSNLSTGWIIAIGLGCLAVMGVGIRMFSK
ncbi:copper resistance protein CopC [Paenibacillus rhizovicinus]|uniref:Copper resistance protein CopC n=1 Tax=Paenibacillus rhizovicinus TaxID=2704463 RepID=A0A6C0NUA2_9BACL|nr:copper resistance protein CopC [Paenibacillus rhizovicinus]QHW29799.1 copper resistance protein CopC [Paenibacillus rhizovicinus]